MTKLLQKAFDAAWKLPKVSRTRWVAFCCRSLPLSDAGKNFFPDHRIYSLTLPTRHWRSTVRGRTEKLDPDKS
jgi:hypothetical protein